LVVGAPVEVVAWVGAVTEVVVVELAAPDELLQAANPAEIPNIAEAARARAAHRGRRVPV
jgi:hypothetical protein